MCIFWPRLKAHGLFLIWKRNHRTTSVFLLNTFQHSPNLIIYFAFSPYGLLILIHLQPPLPTATPQLPQSYLHPFTFILHPIKSCLILLGTFFFFFNCKCKRKASLVHFLTLSQWAHAHFQFWGHSKTRNTSENLIAPFKETCQEVCVYSGLVRLSKATRLSQQNTGSVQLTRGYEPLLHSLFKLGILFIYSASCPVYSV